MKITPSGLSAIDRIEMLVKILAPEVYLLILVIENGHVLFAEVTCDFLDVASIFPCEREAHIVSL